MEDKKERKDIGQRFAEIRKKLNITQSQIAIELKTEQTVVSRTENGDFRLSESMINWAYSQGINLNWLQTGIGEMFRDSNVLRKDLQAAAELINGVINQI